MFLIPKAIYNFKFIYSDKISILLICFIVFELVSHKDWFVSRSTFSFWNIIFLESFHDEGRLTYGLHVSYPKVAICLLQTGKAKKYMAYV